jgi:hypothetical protein
MTSFSKQLGLEYLKADTPRAPKQAQSTTSGDRIQALLVYGLPIVRELKQMGGTGRLHPIISKLNIPIASALESVELMETEGMIAVTNPDVTGNVELLLTKLGERLAD